MNLVEFDLTLDALAAAARRAIQPQPAEETELCPRCNGRRNVSFVLGTRQCPASGRIVAVTRDGVCPGCLGHGRLSPMAAEALRREMGISLEVLP